jgi:hypothetical protein
MTSTTSPLSRIARPVPARSRTETPASSWTDVPIRPRSTTRQCAETATPTSAAHAVARQRLDPLGCYTDVTGYKREVFAVQGLDGSVLVVDRDALTLGDRRLVAHLAADEPAQNATLVCSHYLQDPRRGRCRRVTAEDLGSGLFVEDEETQPLAIGDVHGAELWGRCGGVDYSYRLELVRVDTPALELRWQRRSRRGAADGPTPVSLREVIAAIESYEPACGLTLAALRFYRMRPDVSGAALRTELQRLRESPIVLNRKLRQAVLAAGELQGLSLSEIALRCGRVKRSAKGCISGETSWVARRIGILPESGTGRLTPWVHSDVLALIARNGLGISPREVEL